MSIAADTWNLITAMDAELASIEAGATVQDLFKATEDPWASDLLDAAQTTATRRRDLAEASTSLAARMTQLAENLSRPGWTPNSLGEVQSSGLTVDRQCALLGEAVEQLKRARRRWAKARAQA